MSVLTDPAPERRTRPRARRPALGWFAYLAGLFVLAFAATQVFYFVQIGLWTVFDPSSTAFMRAAKWRFWRDGEAITFEHQWVPYDTLSRNLKRAIIASEDADFVNNKGYEVDAILQAWEKNKRKGQMAAGGSTITQQLARNLFLSTEKTYIRKGQELIITLMLELWMDKERIFEIYMNSVEWGKGVYGAEAAAQHYYKTTAAKLSVGQSARLAVMLPRPKYFDDHRGGPYLTSRAAVIARRMGAAELPSDK
jgi:monofunctional glycosyltransferase